MTRIRDIISLIVVTGFVGVIAILALLPILTDQDPARATQVLKDFAAALSGVVGAIVGFYFGRRE